MYKSIKLYRVNWAKITRNIKKDFIRKRKRHITFQIPRKNPRHKQIWKLLSS